MENKFFSMVGSARPKLTGWLKSAEGLDQYALWDLVESLRNESEWPGVELTVEGGELPDLPSCDVVGRICSPRLVDVLRPFVKDVLWLPMRVRRDAATQTFYFLHFVAYPDVLNERKTKYAGGRVFSPHLSLEKTRDWDAFVLRPLSALVYVRDTVRDAIRKSKLMDIEFQSVDTS